MENLKHTKGEFRRSPCGERGLKFSLASQRIIIAVMSLPVRGAWVEIINAETMQTARSVAPRAGSVG